jgi:hypothetical protein
MLRLLLCGAVLAGCADGAVDDGADAEAESGAAIALGKADADDFAGLYRWSSTRAYWNTDLPSLELVGTTYIRSRCYGYDCANLVPQTGHRQIVRTSSGKVYVRFMSFTRTWDADAEEWLESPALADTYEIKRTSSGIKLRKTYQSRWISLAKVTRAKACTASGGAWSNDECTCDNVANADWSHYVGFFPGLGGCFEIFAANEDGCSETGSYTDDDGTAIGTYCHCPLDTYETQQGCESID